MNVDCAAVDFTATKTLHIDVTTLYPSTRVCVCVHFSREGIYLSVNFYYS